MRRKSLRLTPWDGHIQFINSHTLIHSLIFHIYFEFLFSLFRADKDSQEMNLSELEKSPILAFISFEMCINIKSQVILLFYQARAQQQNSFRRQSHQSLSLEAYTEASTTSEFHPVWALSRSDSDLPLFVHTYIYLISFQFSFPCPTATCHLINCFRWNQSID